MDHDEELLMAVLNSAPVVDGVATEALDGPGGEELARHLGGTGSRDELRHLRRVRDALQRTIHGQEEALEVVVRLIGHAVLAPAVGTSGVEWNLRAPRDEQLGTRAVMAWSRIVESLPGRLRACANAECNLFLVDHSRPGTAKWCSMATCGNRMKARTHARRRRGS